MIREPSWRKFVMDQPNRVLFGIVGPKGIGTHQLGEPIRSDGRQSSTDGPHFMQHNIETGLRDLPGSLGACKAAADDMDGVHCSSLELCLPLTGNAPVLPMNEHLCP